MLEKKLMYAGQTNSRPCARPAARGPAPKPADVLIDLFPSRLSMDRMREIFRMLDQDHGLRSGDGLCTPDGQRNYIWTPFGSSGSPSSPQWRKSRQSGSLNIQLRIRKSRCAEDAGNDTGDLLTCIHG